MKYLPFVLFVAIFFAFSSYAEKSDIELPEVKNTPIEFPTIKNTPIEEPDVKDTPIEFPEIKDTPKQ